MLSSLTLQELPAHEDSLAAKDVAQMRKDQALTWHHVEDMTTMQLVPSDVNGVVAHLGGRTLMDESFTPPLPMKKPNSPAQNNP